MKLNNTVQNRYLFVYVKFSSGLQTVVLVNKPRQQTFKAAATLLREMASKSIVKFTTYYYANSWLTVHYKLQRKPQVATTARNLARCP